MKKLRLKLKKKVKSPVWIYLVGSEASQEDSQNGLNRLPIVKTNHTHKWYFSQEWKMETSPSHQSAMMCVRSKRNTYPLNPRSSMEGSLAKTSQLPDMVKAWVETEVDFSSRCVDWSKKYTQHSSFWKTCRPLGLEAFEKSSENLQLWGMTLDGLVYLPQRLVLTTLGKDGSYWPTPAAEEAGEIDTKRIIPPYQKTPTSRIYIEGAKHHFQSTLNRAIQLWPTPKASDHKDCGPVGSKSWKHRKDRYYLDAMVKEESMPTGKLNPTWVEWLMGYPLDWTELSHWAMQLFPNKLRQRSRDCYMGDNS